MNVNMRLLCNTAPSTINTSAMGCVSAPAKPGAAGGKRGSVLAPAGSAAASAITATSSEEKHDDTAPSEKTLHAAPKKSTYGKLVPVVGSLSPFHEGLEGACTRTGESNFYSADRSYAMVCQPIQPGREYYLVASTFMPHTEMEASLSIWGGAALEHVKVERTGREFHRQVEGRWVGTSAAGPARRKKTWLNNPQFCVRHHGPTPISIVITLTYTGPLGSGGGGGGSLAVGAPGSEASVNISFCTFPVGSADPNPLSAAEKDLEKRKQKEEGKRSAAVEEAKKRKLETERKASLQAQDRLVRGSDAPASSSSGAGASGAGAGAASGGLGVASLRIKSKSAPTGKSGGGKKDRSGAAAPNMFGNALDADDAAADDAAASSSPAGASDSLPRVCPLTTDFELLSQTSFNGDLYRSGRSFHLFVPEVAPERSYFIIPSTAVPGMEGEFSLQVFGASPQAELRLDPCWLNTSSEATAMGQLRGRAQERECASSLQCDSVVAFALLIGFQLMCRAHSGSLSVVCVYRYDCPGFPSHVCCRDCLDHVAQSQEACAWRDEKGECEEEALRRNYSGGQLTTHNADCFSSHRSVKRIRAELSFNQLQTGRIRACEAGHSIAPRARLKPQGRSRDDFVPLNNFVSYSEGRCAREVQSSRRLGSNGSAGAGAVC